MTAIFVLPQSTSVHMLTDGVAYDKSGIVRMTNLAKAHALPTLPAAMSCTGPAILSPVIAENIANEFASFDDLVDRANDWLPEMFEQVAERYRAGDASSTLYLIGWHERTSSPAAYSIELWTDESTRIAQTLANSRDGDRVRRFDLTRAKTINGTPLNLSGIEQSGFEVRREDDYVPEVDLLHIAEVARHERIEGAHWVGGKALLTSIDRRGVTQRVVHHWIEDVVGELITPLPIDWKTWRASRMVASANVDVSGLSRLQRERMLKKAAKGTLRAMH